MLQHQTLVKGYQIEKKIDESGLRSIFRATQLTTGDGVFLTLVPVKGDATLDLLKKRARRAKELSYPGLIVPLDYGVTPEGYFYYSTPAVPSLPLADVLEPIVEPKQFFLTLSGYFLQVLEIIRYLHVGNITHRDITLANLRVDKENRVHLEGFVNSRLKLESRNMVKVVHFPYLSPEQFQGGVATPQSDIYSLGVVMYELITGQLPFDSNYIKVEETRKGNIPHPAKLRVDTPPLIDHGCRRALASTEYRYHSVQEWHDDVKKYYNERSWLAKFLDIGNWLKHLNPFS